MLNDDQNMERTPDLVAKVRKLREEADQKMNRFTCVADYDVRYVTGHGPQPEQAAGEIIVAEPPAAQNLAEDTSSSVVEDQTGEES